MVRAIDVADMILERLGTVPAMKLHKLLYYSQAWSLVWDDAPLFDERIEAWRNGPVIPQVYQYHRGQYAVGQTMFGNADRSVLNDEQATTVKAVLDYYGDQSSQWLSDLTHMEDPWQLARDGLAPTDNSQREISLADMAEYYGSLRDEE